MVALGHALGVLDHGKHTWMQVVPTVYALAYNLRNFLGRRSRAEDGILSIFDAVDGPSNGTF